MTRILRDPQAGKAWHVRQAGSGMATGGGIPDAQPDVISFRHPTWWNPTEGHDVHAPDGRWWRDMTDAELLDLLHREIRQKNEERGEAGQGDGK